jgi:lipoprotein NlpD
MGMPIVITRRQRTAAVQWLFYIVAMVLLPACGASQYAPVQELSYSLVANSGQNNSANKVQTAPASYRVRSGDTLFAIAWRFGWDYKSLAKINAIHSPYTIYVGQKLSFNELNDKNIISKSEVTNSVSNSTLETSKNSKKSTNKLINNNKLSSISVKWSWPIKGRVVKKFTTKGEVFHGIDLASKLGKTVKAASSGIVVYAGSGIQGYGNLVVVKHNDTFLSAYAYNSRILVAEGAQVRAGQVIAEVGKGPQLDARLHFEIRKHGKPVNPLWYLPKL